jgi:beta-lactamase regulating signal transducer with metallopeptidase domain
LDAFGQLIVGNALAATALAAAVAIAARLMRRPAFVHVLWVIVLVRFVAPAVVPVTFDVPRMSLDRPPVADHATDDGKVEIAESTDGLETPREMLASAELDFEPIELAAAAADPFIRAEPVLPEHTHEHAATEGGTTGASKAGSPASSWWERTRSRLGALQGAELGRYAVGIWVLGSCLWLILVVVRVLRFTRRLAEARPAGPAIDERVQELSSRIGLERGPSAVLVSGRISPFVWGFGRRHRLVLPEQLWNRLEARERDALLVHELAHLKRRDHWVRLLELAATGVFWWHPALWWTRRGLHQAEEECCDLWVVRTLPGVARKYAKALVDTVDFLAESPAKLPVGASGLGSSHLSRRIRMILRGREQHSLSRYGALGAGALALVLLPWMPTLAQQKPEEAPAVEQTENAPADDLLTRELKNHEIEILRDRLAYAERMLEKGYLSRSDVENARLELAQAESRVRAEQDLRASDEDDLRDMTEIMMAQLEAKRAQMQRAQARRQAVMATLSRLNKLRESGAVAVEELQKAEGEAGVAEAEVAEKQAELREAEIRLEQVRRRLERLRERRADDEPAPEAAKLKMRRLAPPDLPKGARVKMRRIQPPDSPPRPDTPRVEIRREVDEEGEQAKHVEIRRKVKEDGDEAKVEVEIKHELDDAKRDIEEAVKEIRESLPKGEEIQLEIKKGLEEARQELDKEFSDGRLRVEIRKGLDEARRELEKELPKVKDEIRKGLEEARREIAKAKEEGKLPEELEDQVMEALKVVEDLFSDGKLEVEIRDKVTEALDQVEKVIPGEEFEVELREKIKGALEHVEKAIPGEKMEFQIREKLEGAAKELEERIPRERAKVEERVRAAEVRARQLAEEARERARAAEVRARELSARERASNRDAERRIRELEQRIRELESELRGRERARAKEGAAKAEAEAREKQKAKDDDDDDEDGDDDGEERVVSRAEVAETPSAPETPRAPEAPETPRAPEAPSAREAPETPEAPRAPEAPSAPEAPRAPEAPVERAA